MSAYAARNARTTRALRWAGRTARLCWPAVLWLWTGVPARAGVPDEARQGAQLFRDSSYKEAADAFRQATIASPDDARWRYDLGLSEAKSNDFESAINNLETTARTADPRIAGAALYNAGNVHYATGDYQKAAAAYRDALRHRPDDPDAKRNLELALRQLQQQQQQQEQNKQNPDSSKQNRDQQQKQDKGKNDQQSDQSDQQEQKPGQNSEQQPDQSQSDSLNQSRAHPDSSVTREQAERILKALADEEARLRDNARNMRVLPAPGGKDW